ncbi:MAG: stage II sporulation protein M [Candidatus Nanoarchaeia archaeon]
MVLEKIYKPDFLKNHPAYALLMGITYSLLGIIVALVMFPSDPALIAVGITTLLLLPEFAKLSVIEEKIELMEKHFGHFLWSQRNFYKIYLYMFAGVFITFVVLSLFLPSLAANYMFKTQINVISGHATFTLPLFKSLITNNLYVLGLCFIIALIMGAGAVFLVVWNASVWGTIFGTLAKSAALTTGKNQIIIFILILLSVLPHMFLEISSYIWAAISGNLLSEGIVNGQARHHIKKIIWYNLVLLIIAIVILIIGMAVETYVLGNFETYATIIDLAFK